MNAPRILFATALLVTLAALGWTEENWRAARDWAACQRDMAARGERLDLSAAYDPLPPERNLARAPLFTHCFNYTVDAASGLVTSSSPIDVKYNRPPLGYMPWPSKERMTEYDPAPPFSIFRGERIDLRAWQASFQQHSAEGLLHALEIFAPVLDDVERSAAMMPDGVFALAPTSFSADPFIAVRSIVQTLTLRACTHLAAGQSAEARHDLELIFWLRQAAITQPRSFLGVALGCNYTELALQAVWEGLANHRWTADDLTAIQGRMQSVDLLAGYRLAAIGQRANFLFLADGFLDGRYKYANLFSPGDGWSGRISAWALMHGPSGWFVRNKVNISQYFQDYLVSCVDVPAHRFDPKRLKAGLDALTRIYARPVWPWQYLLATGMPGFLRAAERCALTQTALDEAIVACALERFALAHGGSEPADLGALVPEYLDHVPPSVIDGKPLRYTPTADGRYRLTAPLPLRETEKPPGSMIQANELVWGYPSGH